MKKITVQNKAGLHARPSSLFVQLASTYDSDIKVRFEGEEINGKSIMGLRKFCRRTRKNFLT